MSGYVVYVALSFPRFIEKWLYSIFAKICSFIYMKNGLCEWICIFCSLSFPRFLDLYKRILDLVDLHLFLTSMLVWDFLVDFLDFLKLLSYFLMIEFLWNGWDDLYSVWWGVETWYLWMVGIEIVITMKIGFHL